MTKFRKFIEQFLYIPKKSSEIYNIVFAHRGWHTDYKENTIAAYNEAFNHIVNIKNIGIELDVRILSDDTIICIHDRYARRILDAKGKISKMDYNEVLSYKVFETDHVPKLKEVLQRIDGKIPLLIEIKGFFCRRFQEKLQEVLANYNGRIYFHLKNLIAYYRAKRIWKDKVFWVLNPFRKRFNFIKKKDYGDICKDI